jgi:UDP-N-acetylmuramate--L-alanine ligase
MSDPCRIHLIGIGGSGMFPLAMLLKQAGYVVTGSDRSCAPERIVQLEQAGIVAYGGSDADVMRQAECVVVSPAIPETNTELRAARRFGITVKTRAEVLADLILNRTNICVAGSHGKSTTTAMLTHILQHAQEVDFGYMLGANFADAATVPAHLGEIAAPFVMEACEAHGALAHWQPFHAIVTNVDDDHADHYGGKAELFAAFSAFLDRVPVNGVVVACGDDVIITRLLCDKPCTILTYGFADSNRLRASQTATGQTTVVLDGTALGALQLSVPGRHNILNALAAIGMARTLGIGFETAADALRSFVGVSRRLQRVETGAPWCIFDDFAHHPTEIVAALSTLREVTSGRLIAVLEPQLHSRVARLAPSFAQALRFADVTYLLPVAALGEPMGAIDGDAALLDACRTAGVSTRSVSDKVDLRRELSAVLREGDTVIVMAGGDGSGIAASLAKIARPNTAQASRPSIMMGEPQALPPDLLTIISGHAARHPEAAAIQQGRKHLTYREILTRVEHLCALLSRAGVVPGSAVGVCLGQTTDRVTAFLSILRLGGIYVPLDPTLPDERLGYMIDVANVRTVVVNASSPALQQTGLTFVNCGQLSEESDHPHDRNEQIHGAGTTAYMIFTSGTTGKPKAVEVSRGSIANYAVAAARHFDITQAARVSQINGFGFDVSVGDMAMTLAAGACLVFPTDVEAVPGPPLARFIKQAGLTHISLTPSALSVVPPGDFPQLTHVIVVGEACPPVLVARWGTNRRFINAYGPTEATVEALFADCHPGQPVTIGKPMANTGACIVNPALEVVAQGEEGELCLFGPGLARGYRNMPELTERRFPHVFFPGYGYCRLYRTGDLSKIGPDGNFVFLGRIDRQMKLNGYRIEAGEVEAALCALPEVLDAAVSLVSSDNHPDRLVAHVVASEDGSAPDPDQLRRHLSLTLPSYMVPSFFLPVPQIPRNANGKRDPSALPLPPQLTAPPAARTTGTRTERRVMELVDEYAGGNTVTGTRDSLRDAGIDSLTMANILFGIEETFGITLDARFDAGFDTVEVLALMVDARKAEPVAQKSTGLEEMLASKIMPYLVNWPGERRGAEGLVRTLSTETMLPNLFWCFQGGPELLALSHGVAGVANVYGIRSGHLALDYDDETLIGLGRLYAEEVHAVSPSGPVFLGGNCQGALVIQQVGQELVRRGRDVRLTILVEQGRFYHYAGRTLLIFGAGSYLNPYGQMLSPDSVFRAAYPAGYDAEIIPGAHGQYFKPHNVGAFAATIRRHLDRYQAPALEMGGTGGGSAHERHRQ